MFLSFICITFGSKCGVLAFVCLLAFAFWHFFGLLAFQLNYKNNNLLIFISHFCIYKHISEAVAVSVSVSVSDVCDDDEDDNDDVLLWSMGRLWAFYFSFRLLLLPVSGFLKNFSSTFGPKMISYDA